MEDKGKLTIIYNNDYYELTYLGIRLQTKRLPNKIRLAVEWLIENGYTNNPDVQCALQNRVTSSMADYMSIAEKRDNDKILWLYYSLKASHTDKK